MSYILYALSVICAVIISYVYLDKPLEERGIEGIGSVAIRIVVGVAIGILIGFLIEL